MTNQMYQMTSEVQKYSSKMTSINSKRLPAIYHKINWERLKSEANHPFPRVLDYGCGRYIEHIKEFVNSQGCCYSPYDPYWGHLIQNQTSLLCEPDIVLCSNVLNTIAENKIIIKIVSELLSYDKPVVISIYEGDKSWIGRESKKDCWQRNQTLDAYCVNNKLQTYHGVITTDKSIIL